MATLDCYGDTIESLADLSGTFDLASLQSYRKWWLDQWSRIAARLGFSKEFEQAMTGVLQYDLGSVEAEPLNAFGRFAEARANDVAVAGPWNAKLLARIRAESILAFKNQKTGIFDAVLSSWDLPAGGCAGQYRAFQSTAAPSYLRDQEGTTPRTPTCEWKGNVRIAFGLFPWYAGSLAPAPEGLAWARDGDHHPARDAMALCQGFMIPLQNAREDARRVMELYDRFIERTRPVIEGLPDSSTRPGAIYRDGRRLAVHMGVGSEAQAVVIGPRGPIGVQAYNYAIERFAAFFALRRQLMEQFSHAPAAVQDALRSNPDPCLGPFVTPAPKPKPSTPGGIKPKPPQPKPGSPGGIKVA